MKPDVTFIVAAYRSADTVGEAIESALAQDGVDVEVIVVDDASPDKPADAARDHASDRVRFHARAQNGGPGAARNDALDRAAGRWIAVLDADDAIRPERTRALLDLADGNGFDCVVDNLLVEDLRDATSGSRANGPMFDPARWASRGELDLATFIGADTLFEGTGSLGYLKPMIRRDFIERHALRYDPSIRVGEDFQFLARVLSHGARCAVHPGTGYRYRLASGSVSRTIDLEHVETMKRAAGDLERLAGPSYRTEAVRAAVERRNRSLDRAEAYLSTVDAIKRRDAGLALRTAFADPSAALLLRLPVFKRCGRLGRSIAARLGLAPVRTAPNDAAAGPAEGPALR